VPELRGQGVQQLGLAGLAERWAKRDGGDGAGDQVVAIGSRVRAVALKSTQVQAAFAVAGLGVIMRVLLRLTAWCAPASHDLSRADHAGTVRSGHATPSSHMADFGVRGEVVDASAGARSVTGA